MALAIDASTPAIATQATSTVATVTSASFTPPAGSTLLIMYSANTVDPTSPATPTITDNLGAHLTYTLSDFSVRADTPAADGQAAIWTAPIASSAAMTITVTNQAPSGSRHAALDIVVLTGANSTSVGAHGKSGSISTGSIAQSYTAQATSGWGFLAVIDWAATGPMSAGAGCTLIGSANLGAPDITYGFFRRTSADDSLGVSNTLNATLGGTSNSLRWAYVEIVPAVTSIPWAPQRMPSVRDYGETQWGQRDRRDANLVGAAANPLAAPLDSAWQAGGRHWHLYNDAARTGWRPQQRAATDPTLLSSVAATIPFAAPRSVPARDSGEVQWTQRRTTDVTLLGTAELENELLGGGDTLKRYLEPATHGPRSWPPEQPKRDGTTPGLLDSAELENELLGSGTTAERAGTPATNGIRWWMPQQPPRNTPTLMDQALLEVPAGPPRQASARPPAMPQQPARPASLDTATALDVPLLEADRHATWYSDRRQQPAQRAFPAAVDAPVVADPLTVAFGAGGTLWHLWNTATDQASRAWWPKQRPYLSDPSFYPTVAPADPLTLAYGAGGTYWLLYNLAAAAVDRRNVPKQRSYVSDPALLGTAQLEGPLLFARTRTVATAPAGMPQARPQPDPQLLTSLDSPLSYMPSRVWFPRPAAAVQQPSRGAALADVLDVPLLGDRQARRYLIPATHTDRRQTVRQPVWLVFVGAPAPTVQRATSFPSAVDGRTSTGSVTAGRASSRTVIDLRASNSGVAGGRTSSRAVTDRRTSDPTVDGS